MAGRYGLEIRSATLADAPGLAELMSGTGPSVSIPVVAARLQALIEEDAVVLLALEWGPPSGVIVLNRRRRLDADASVAQITTLLVAQDARRRGIARLLLKTAAQAARLAGCQALQLHASPEQTDLRAFCLATGFAEPGAVFERALRKRS